MNDPRDTLYDRDDYYLATPSGSRLTPALDGLLALLEWERVLYLWPVLRRRHGNALDVGAGDGKFLRLARSFGLRVTGTTASRRSAAAAREKFGIRLHVSEALDEATGDGPFDLVTYWHVFEHLRTPSDHTDQWRNLLTDGGTLVVEVPNVASIGARLCYRAWLGSDPVHHVNHMDPRQLADTIEDAGLEIQRVQHLSLKFSYPFLWSALLGRLFPVFDFDRIMDLLKRPRTALRMAPLTTLNGLASIVYLAPIVTLLMLVGLATRRGEVVRVFAQKRGV